jgi:Mg-chelatase subunit ChlD
LTAAAAACGIDRYGFLASGIAGRRVAVQWATRGGALAYTDGQSIFLPAPDPATAADPWAAITAQAALIGAGSLQASMLRQLVGRPSAARRYLYLEMLRAARVLCDRLPWAFTERTELRPPARTAAAQDSLDLALGQEFLPEPPDYFGRIVPFMGIRTAVSEQGWTALSRKQQQGQMKTAAAPDLDDGDEGESSQILRLFQNPFASGNPLSDLLNNILGAGVSKSRREAAAGDGGGAELPLGRVEQALKRGVHAVLSRLPLHMPAPDPATATPAFVYPEWDVHANAYRRDWVFIEETEPFREDGPQAFGHLLKAAPVELRRQLSGLGVDQELHRRQSDGSDLDLGALIECAIELRAGHSPPALQVYRTSRRTRRDLAVTIVVDISGSTAEEPGGGDSTFKKQLAVAYQLGQVLDSLGDRVAMFGFHSWGRKLVRVVRLKGHAERWSVRVAERMALLEPVGYTRIGAAIRHGTHLLNDTMRLPNRLLVLVTDGIAYDQDYELRHAAADAGRALAEARKVGTACVCLCVGSGSDTGKLEDVFGAANILAVDEVGQVTGRIREVCRHALASVSKRRFAASR